MLLNSNNICLLKSNCINLTKYFKHATEIGTGMSAEGQIVPKPPFSAILKRFLSFLFSGTSKISVEKIYMVTVYGSHQYLHFNLNAWNLENKWIVILLSLTMEPKREYG